MGNALFWVILAIIIADYIFDRVMDLLNASRLTGTLPAELAGIYDEGKYRRSQEYSRVKMRLGLVTASLSFALIMAMLITGGFGWLDEYIRQYTGHPVWMALLFFGIVGLAADLISTPFDVYGTFVVEERFGFNRTSPTTYITDKLKGWLLAMLIGGALLAVFVWFHSRAGELFWLYAWMAFSGFSIFMAMFYSTLIVPLFNKQTPLEEGELRTAIEEFAEKTGFRLDNIYVIDGSRRSSKANAYFSGLGPKKRIVLFDTLIKDHTTEELVAVLAHEIGHYKKKHSLKGMMVSLIHTGVMLFLLGMFINRPELSLALGGQQPSFHLGILAFALLYAPVSLVLGVAGNYMSRRHEYQADAFAAEHYGAKPLMDALKKLSVNNLSNLRPHPAYVFAHYSHPPLLKRLEYLENYIPGPANGQ
jgi:STE24 endopeptidase